MAEVLIKDQKRKNWLDALRALAMLFVIFGHFYTGDPTVSYFTAPVKVPMFFVISGYLLDQKDDTLKSFPGKLLKGLVIPWLALTILPELLLIPFKGFSNFFTEVLKIFTGEKYWYIPCCLLAQLLFVLCRKLIKNTWVLVAVCMGLTVVGYAVSQHGLLKLFALNTALTAQSFLLLGLVLRRLEQRMAAMKPWMLPVLLGVYLAAVVAGLVLYPHATFDVHEGIYYNAGLCALQILLGSAALFALAARIQRYPRWLIFIGQNTLVYYIYHTWVRTVIEVVLERFGVILPKAWYISVAMTVVVCLLCGVGAALLNWLLPELVGRKRMKKVQI